MTPPPRSPTASQQTPRRTAELPGPLVRTFIATTRAADGPPAATLAYSWLLDAVLRARAGLPLPPAAGAPPVGPNQGTVKWTQTATEFQAWRGELQAAGSSVRAVLADRIQRYSAGGGDPVAAIGGDPVRDLSRAS